MENKTRISVAMATYNGEKYIKEQIDSILLNLQTNDEIIISDDGSTDDTVEIINNYNDKRIKIYDGPKNGLIKNFENAIKNCKGKYIFLSDQDDIWEKDKVKTVINVFEVKKCSVVIHDCVVVDENNSKILNNSFYSIRKSKKGFLKNVIKNSYIGCCMAFESDLIKNIVPIPTNIAMHDQWIGLLGEINGNGSVFIEEKLIHYRRHENNVSNMKHGTLKKMIKCRIAMLKEIFKR